MSEDILVLLRDLQARQGRTQVFEAETSLEAIGFRSLDFAELALRLEQMVGYELNFDAGRMRAIRTVNDLVDFLSAAAAERA